MSYTAKSDSELVKLYISGKETAFEVLLLRHQSRIFTFIVSKVKDQDLANDLFQDTFIKVVNTLKSGKYNDEGKFLPWVMRIAHNLVIDHFRKNNRVKMISETTYQNPEYTIFHILSDQSLNVEQEMIKEELESQLIELIEFLPESQKEVLKMRLYQDLSFQEIADQEEVSINTALGRMRYALINLRKYIDENQLMVNVA
ncbi:MAG: RNA polymerase sigma factor [Crocinitomicaceae bacterium]